MLTQLDIDRALDAVWRGFNYPKPAADTLELYGRVLRHLSGAELSAAVDHLLSTRDRLTRGANVGRMVLDAHEECQTVRRAETEAGQSRNAETLEEAARRCSGNAGLWVRMIQCRIGKNDAGALAAARELQRRGVRSSDLDMQIRKLEAATTNQVRM
jgi:hypothetical protein